MIGKTHSPKDMNYFPSPSWDITDPTWEHSSHSPTSTCALHIDALRQWECHFQSERIIASSIVWKLSLPWFCDYRYPFNGDIPKHHRWHKERLDLKWWKVAADLALIQHHPWEVTRGRGFQETSSNMKENPILSLFYAVAPRKHSQKLLQLDKIYCNKNLDFGLKPMRSQALILFPSHKAWC